MFAGSALLAHPDWSVLAAVPAELDMDLPLPGKASLQSSALSREGTLTTEEQALVTKSLGLSKRGRPPAEELPPNLPAPKEAPVRQGPAAVLKRPAAVVMKRPAAVVMKRPAAAAAGEGASRKRPAAVR